MVKSMANGISMENTRSPKGGAFGETRKWGNLQFLPTPDDTHGFFKAMEFRHVDFPVRSTGSRFTTTTLFIPYWLILAVLILTWLSLSIWRARRIGKVREAAGARVVSHEAKLLDT